MGIGCLLALDEQKAFHLVFLERSLLDDLLGNRGTLRTGSHDCSSATDLKFNFEDGPVILSHTLSRPASVRFPPSAGSGEGGVSVAWFRSCPLAAPFSPELHAHPDLPAASEEKRGLAGGWQQLERWVPSAGSPLRLRS